MKWYLFCRSGLILFVVILIWLCANIFINVPPDFSKYYGKVVHKELVKSYESHRGDNYHIYNFTYLNKSGKICKENGVEFKEDSPYYDKFINNDQYYDANGFNISVFVFLCIWGFFGTLFTLLVGNDMNEYFSSEKETRIRARNMRIKHFKMFVDFWGYDNEQEREDTHAAIEQFKENDSKYLTFKRYGGTLDVPTWNYIYDEVLNNYNKIVKQRNQKETNITDGEINEEKRGGFCD